MGRGDRQGRFRPPPVERIELDEEHLRRRFITAGVLLLFGAALLAYAVMKFLTPAAGWQVIQANSTGEASCAEEITFLYEAASPAEVKAAAARYTDACQRAYRLFHCRQEFEAVVNVCTLNRRPNEVLAVDGALYEALATAVGGGRRELYLGPIYARYGDLFFCQDDAQLVNYDPRLSADVAREYQEVLAYANDPQSIEVELLGENQVRLRVSEAYLAYAEREGIDRFIDFAWMQDAFVVDLLAGELEAGGFTKGVLSSYDGFTWNLDSREGSYEYPLYHRQGGEVRFAANMRYWGPASMVCLRDFPTSEQDFGRFYTLRSGEVRTPYLDTADALCRNGVSSLLCYGREKGCGQLLMEMIPVYITEDFRPEAAAAMAADGVQSVFCQGAAVYYTEAQAVLEVSEEGGYTAERISP